MTSERRRDRRHRSADREGPRPDTPYSEVYLVIGRIVAPHGVRGEVKVSLVTDRPERLADLRRVYLDDSTEPVRLLRSRLHSNGRQAILKLEGIDDRDTAGKLRGVEVKIRGDQLPPPEEGAFFHYQVIGLEAFDEEGDLLGTVTEIIDAGEVDVYVVTAPDGSQQLFPALADVVLEIDPSAGRMVISPPEWED